MTYVILGELYLTLLCGGLSASNFSYFSGPCNFIPEELTWVLAICSGFVPKRSTWCDNLLLRSWTLSETDRSHYLTEKVTETMTDKVTVTETPPPETVTKTS